MGSLAAAYAATPELGAGKDCGVLVVLRQLEGEDRDWFQVAVNDTQYTATRLSRAMLAAGYKISDQTIRRHRNGCSCAAR